MDLILWRHAEARDAADGESDLERPLTSRGIKQAERMAEWLNRFLPQSTKILVSPSVRTSSFAFSLASSQIVPCRTTSAPYPRVAATLAGVAFSAMQTTARMP